ncbi:hypothetical protein CK203_021370 [Vitis vinifera]|uniref:Uncharacterized protein n=1 Tax=Vitis vinifera TaxID=29760 RepID=A0A438IS10_VITVI|nr:hypothetical protein CK203_021370 [Vitis vinifera]
MAQSRIHSCSATTVNVRGMHFKGGPLPTIRGLATGKVGIQTNIQMRNSLGRRNVGGGRLSGMTQQGLLVTVNDSDNSSKASASDIHVVRMTASWPSSSFCQFALGTFSIPTFSPLCLFFDCFWLVGVPVASLHLLRVTDPALGFRFGPTLPAKKDVVSSSAARQSGKDASGVVYAEKSINKLNVRQFCERFCISNGVSVQLVDGEVVSTEKSADNAIYFSKDILSILFNLDLSLLEVLFIYSIKKGKTDLFSLAAYMSSLQLVTHLTDSTKGRAKGHVLVRDTTKKGRLVERVEKTFFDRLNKLFEITIAKRHHQTLLTARNLLAVVREPQSYVTNILPRRSPKRVVSGEHFVLKDLPFYERARKADAKARQERLDQREEKRQEGTLRKALGEKERDSPPAARPPTTKEKKKTKKTLAQVLRIAAPTLKASSSSCSFLQLVVFHQGPSSPQPDPESAGLQVVDEPEEMRNTRPAPEVSTLVATRPDEDGPSASSAAPPDAAGPSAATMVQADTPGPGSHVVVDTPMSEGVPDEKSSRAAAVPPSREELMEMLKGVPCFTDAEARLLFGTSESVVPYSQPLQERTILETAEVVIANIRHMMRTREQLFKRLQVAEAMRAFISQHPGGVEELRAQLKKVEAKLATAQKVVADGSEQLCRVEGEKEVIRAETDILKKEKEALEGQVNEVGREILQLKRDTEELWASLAAQKESEDLRGVWRLKKRRWRLGSPHRRRRWRKNTSSRRTRCTSSSTTAV